MNTIENNTNINHCIICDKPIKPYYELCYNCLEYKRIYGLPNVRIKYCDLYDVENYDNPTHLDIIIRAFKTDPTHAKKLGELLIKTIQEKYPDFIDVDFIVPVPTSNQEKGFNQSELLADEVSNYFKIPIKDILIKDPNTGAQHNNPAKNKITDIRGKISCIERIDDKKILILDDTMISGGTIFESAHELEKNGAVSIKALVLGRGIDDKHRKSLQSGI